MAAAGENNGVVEESGVIKYDEVFGDCDEFVVINGVVYERVVVDVDPDGGEDGDVEVRLVEVEEEQKFPARKVRPKMKAVGVLDGAAALNAVDRVKAFKKIEDIIAQTRPSIAVYKKTYSGAGVFFRNFLPDFDIETTPPTEEMYLNYADYLRNDCKYAASTVCSKMSMISSIHCDKFGERPMKWDRLVAYVFAGLRDHESKKAKQFDAGDIFAFVSIRTENRHVMVRQMCATLGYFGTNRGVDLRGLTWGQLTFQDDGDVRVNFARSKQPGKREKEKSVFLIPTLKKWANVDPAAPDFADFVRRYRQAIIKDCGEQAVGDEMPVLRRQRCVGDPLKRDVRSPRVVEKNEDGTVKPYPIGPDGKTASGRRVIGWSARFGANNGVVGVDVTGYAGVVMAAYLGMPEPERHTGHCWRGSSATCMTNRGADGNMLMRAGGWSNIRTVQRYLRNAHQQNVDKVAALITIPATVMEEKKAARKYQRARKGQKRAASPVGRRDRPSKERKRARARDASGERTSPGQQLSEDARKIDDVKAALRRADIRILELESTNEGLRALVKRLRRKLVSSTRNSRSSARRVSRRTSRRASRRRRPASRVGSSVESVSSVSSISSCSVGSFEAISGSESSDGDDDVFDSGIAQLDGVHDISTSEEDQRPMSLAAAKEAADRAVEEARKAKLISDKTKAKEDRLETKLAKERADAAKKEVRAARAREEAAEKARKAEKSAVAAAKKREREEALRMKKAQSNAAAVAEAGRRAINRRTKAATETAEARRKRLRDRAISVNKKRAERKQIEAVKARIHAAAEAGNSVTREEMDEVSGIDWDEDFIVGAPGDDSGIGNASLASGGSELAAAAAEDRGGSEPATSSAEDRGGEDAAAENVPEEGGSPAVGGGSSEVGNGDGTIGSKKWKFKKIGVRDDGSDFIVKKPNIELAPLPPPHFAPRRESPWPPYEPIILGPARQADRVGGGTASGPVDGKPTRMVQLRPPSASTPKLPAVDTRRPIIYSDSAPGYFQSTINRIQAHDVEAVPVGPDCSLRFVTFLKEERDRLYAKIEGTQNGPYVKQ